jgi:sugar lactone lactonase YvrE
MIYVSDRDGQTIRGITLSAEKTTVTTVAGQAYSSGFTDAEALSATFSSPKDLAWYDGGLLILDSGNGALRYLKDGAVTTLSDPSWFTAPVSLAVSSDNRIFVVDQGDQTIKVIDGGRVMSIYAGLTTRSGYDEGGSDTATFATPLGIAVDQSGNVFVGDQNGLVIRKIDTGQVVSTYAGSNTSGNADGALLSATFSAIASLASLPTGEMIILDGKASLIRQIRRSK